MSMAPDASNTRMLLLRSVRDVAQPSKLVAGFVCWEHAVGHLKKHLLTPMESVAWSIICPTYRETVNPNNAEACARVAAKANQTAGASIQKLYDAYMDAVDQAGEQARSYLRVAVGNGIAAVLGLNGVFVVIDRKRQALATAFVPGKWQLHTRGMRTPRHGGTGVASPPSKSDSREQTLYYDIFHPVFCHLLGAAERGLNGDRSPILTAKVQLSQELQKCDEPSFKAWRLLIRLGEES